MLWRQSIHQRSEMSILLGVEHTLRGFFERTQECQNCLLHVGTTVQLKKQIFDYLDNNEIKCSLWQVSTHKLFIREETLYDTDQKKQKQQLIKYI